MSCWAAPFRVPLVYPTLRKNERIAAPGVSQIRFQLFLSRAHPRCVVLLGNSHALVAQQNRDSFDGNASKKQFNSERVAEAVRMPIRKVCVHWDTRLLRVEKETVAFEPICAEVDSITDSHPTVTK